MAAMSLNSWRRLTPLFALAACAIAAATADASSLIVPDSAATIQGALNVGVDTVFVRSGAYAEIPVLFAQVALVGIPGDPAFERPVLEGLKFTPAYGSFPTLAVRGIECTGPVYVQNDEVLSFLVLDHCRLDAGISDISAYPATARITVRNCAIDGNSLVKADGSCVVDSCVFTGQLVLGEENCRLFLTNSQFHGDGTGYAISTIGQGSDIMAATANDNTVSGYTSGITLSAILSIEMTGNQVSDCAVLGLSGENADIVRIEQNQALRCGEYGILADAGDSLIIVGNTVGSSGNVGISAGVGTIGRVAENVVWGSHRDGLWVDANPVGELLEVRNNTSCLNWGSGFVSWAESGGARYDFAGNIGAGNGAYGVSWRVAGATLVGCNDWFGNSLGVFQGLPLSSGDFTVDPGFCDAASGDFHLAAKSPLIGLPGCGLVGALGVGCDVTATLVSRFAAERVLDGIKITWELTKPSTADEAWLERSDSGDQGPWDRPETARSQDGRAEVELDRTVAPDRVYWYRLVAAERNGANVIGAPIMVELQAGATFRLALVGPSPSDGPVRIEFDLAHQAGIALEVFDVQGRLVASPAQGVWPAGRHAATWPSDGARMVCGVYLVRYRYPGGEIRRRLIRTP